MVHEDHFGRISLNTVTPSVLCWLADIQVFFHLFSVLCTVFFSYLLSVAPPSFSPSLLSVSERGSVWGEDVGNSWAPSLLIVGLGET